jgi:hypothetical protein
VRGLAVAENEERERVAYFSNNLVGIAATQVYGNPARENTFFIAGCILSIKQEWFFVTAGHCLEQLDQAFHQTKIERIRLVDYAGRQSIHHEPIPFVDYENTFRRYWNETNGVDFGFVYLSPYHRRLLEANKVRVHDEVQWRRQPKEFEVAWMLGFPSALVQKLDPSTYLFSASMIPLDILKHTPEQYIRDSPSDLSEEDRRLRDAFFYAVIPKDHPLPKNEKGEDDIHGMSGGPILGVAHSLGKLKYWVAAIQSSWFPESRVIRAVPLPAIGHYLSDLYQAIVDEWVEAHPEGSIDIERNA